MSNGDRSRVTEAAAIQVVANRLEGDRYGVVSDRFGNRWAISTHKEDVPPDEMKRRMDKAIAEMKTK